MNSNSYKDMSDEELIVYLRNGSPEIMDYIMEKYKNLVRKRANAMFLIGGETEDLIQEGMIGLFKAIRDFKEEKESSFYHFADLCVSRQIYNAVEASQRKKHQPLNAYVSLNVIEGENGNGIPEMIMMEDSADPAQMLIAQEEAVAMKEAMNQRLSKMEREVLELYLQGLTYTQIAIKLEKKPKAIDNALQRIKGKLSDIKSDREEKE